jgi:tetratricopeptide (TPR) repeat protein
MAKAVGALDKSIELKASNAESLSLRAQLRMGSGDEEGARKDAEAALKLDTSNVAMRMLLAELLRRSGDVPAALAQVDALAKIDTARAQVHRGEILLSLDRPTEALAAFNRALTFEKDPMTYVHRARALPATDKAGLRRELEAALALNPTDAPSLSGLSRIASQVGDHARALQLLDQAFLRSPDNIGIRHARAVEMMLAGKADAAEREFDAISSKELSAEELNNLCWTKALANVALDRAMEECDRSLAKEERSATRDSRAMVLLRQARFDDAIAEFGVALKNGEMAAPLYGRALAYARKGDKAKSDADAERASKLSPGIARIYSHYGLDR